MMDQALQRTYQRLDGSCEVVDDLSAGQKLVRYGNDPISPILVGENECLALVGYESHHLDPFEAWLHHSHSHGIAQVVRVTPKPYLRDDQTMIYYLASHHSAQQGVGAVYHYAKLYLLEERLLGTSFDGYVLLEREELHYPYPATHRLFVYVGQKIRRG